MLYFLERLQDSSLVASFQRTCGLYQSNEEGKVGPQKSGQVLAVQPDLMRDKPTEAPEVSRNGNLVRRHSDTNGANGFIKKRDSPKYIVKNQFLYYLFRFAAALGQEVFYITFLPNTFWNFDPYVSRRLVSMWAIVMYIGQTSKDLLKWPRPSSPPVMKLETRVEAEYGMPSTHAMAATAISFTFLLCTMDRYKYPFQLGLATAVILSLLVSLSRLYTGMHTVLDVICGILIAALLVMLTYPFWDSLDQLLLTSSTTPLLAVVVPFFLCLNYPKLDHYSPSRGDTTIILGVATGSTVGFWTNYQLGETYEPTGEFPLSLPPLTCGIVLTAAARVLVGLLCLLVVRQVVKGLMLKVLCTWFDVSVKDKDARQRLEIEVPYKFVTYSSIGFSTTVPVPHLLMLLGLM
ncbi:sphingosine-1-phosphate phosphatase 2 isoform X1 [Polypterus senegalus]|uniref:sphingosine-1-phosphate phosphatase 2 isoform X1 n=1 Tax=Polypterus senegalus TaxID=55291 RepID=UPI001964DEAB|nr:sphingosine-1-phosphate phosphatase 2 isoform X1 [Polypterus senegalus]